MLSSVSELAIRGEQRLLAVPEPVAPLFPNGGLPPGASVGVAGTGGWSLALALAGAALGADGWLAVVGAEGLGLVAAGELGVRLDRIIMVETPAPDRWPTVAAALIEAFDIVCLGPTRRLGHRQAARLGARARETQTLLLHLDGGRSWPEALDATLTVHPRHWAGLGSGHGYLQHRLVTVTATGRRSMARHRQVDVLLPGPDGRLAPVPDTIAAAPVPVTVAAAPGPRPGSPIEAVPALQRVG